MADLYATLELKKGASEQDIKRSYRRLAAKYHPDVNKEENAKVSYPSCIRTEGIAPSQYGTKGLISEKLAEIEEKYDLNADALLAMGEEGEEAEASEDAEEEEAEDTGAEEEFK